MLPATHPARDTAGPVDTFQQLLELLEVEQIGSDKFVARSPVLPNRRNIFGGQVMAQTLRAAAATVDPDRPPHSLHAYFLREGRFEEDLVLDVVRSRDGRSFSSRDVTVSQAGRPIFTMSASFHRDEPGPEYATSVREVSAPAPDRPNPLAIDGTSMGFELAPGEPPTLDHRPAYLLWARSLGAVPQDRVLHACLLAYLSDLGAGGVAASAVGYPAPTSQNGPVQMASLDHAMWFHRPTSCDEWVLIDAAPMSVGGSRGTIVGTVHDGSGRHAASFAQELLVRSRI
jgi:acyl-CoA thioesterase-2